MTLEKRFVHLAKISQEQAAPLKVIVGHVPLLLLQKKKIKNQIDFNDFIISWLVQVVGLVTLTTSKRQLMNMKCIRTAGEK